MTRRALIAHRDAIVAEALAVAIGRFPGVLPVGIATTCADAVECASEIDVAVVDALLDGATGATLDLRRSGVRVVLLGETPEGDEQVYVSPSESVSTLAAVLIPGTRRSRDDRPELTSREQEVLTLVANGMAAKQVASHLGISPKTVEQHKSRIFTKLGVTNQTAAVSRAHADGIGGVSPWIHSSI